MFYFLDNFPFLLTFMVIINDQLCIKKQKEKKCGFLHDKFVNNNLPLKFIIPPEAITIKNLIKKSNAEVYDGIYKKSAVALKRIPKMDFKLNELKSIINLKSTPGTGRKCKGCEQDECQNIIDFHGCFEIDEFVWIVMEKAKEDFKDFKFTNQEVKLQILFDTVKGLECLHANSISHLDIKPGNILVVERNKKLVGCLADFGESIDAIKKTYTRSKIRGTDGYIAPELEEAFKSDQKTRSNNKKRFILNYSKCDIYSLGMVIKKDYLNSIDKKESLDMNLMICEELVNYMTEKDPTSRPDVETVRKNPVFWDVTQKLKFLEHVHEYGDGHTTDPFMKKRIENMIRNRKNWVNSLKLDDKMTMEIEKYMKKKRKEQKGAEKSIFALVELILFILKEEAANCFPNTRQLLKATDAKIYLDFWYKNFEISFLYYYMQDVFKYNREFYSTEQLKRHFTAVKRIEADKDDKVYPILLYTPSTSTFIFPKYISPEIGEIITKVILGIKEGTTNPRALGRLVGNWSGLRSIEQ
ncbi:unnamed protein product [Chironomus riparius]|uniref:Protein kinase domain-containing protein n=1 Tax=Chironomus riparius TaxID=315576 RepID=A0A9N9WVB8_9DIPT|nr:unnamed protein product [Chironomus riparius]